MFYVIKKQLNNYNKCFLAFAVSKFTTSKTNNNVIFEFNINGKKERKWIKKDDIILLTDDKNFYLKTLDSFKQIEMEQVEKIKSVEEQLNKSKQEFIENIDKEIEEFQLLRYKKDTPCILKKYTD